MTYMMEYVAEALWQKPQICCFAPDEYVKGYHEKTELHWGQSWSGAVEFI